MNAANAIHFIYTRHTFILMLPSFAALSLSLSHSLSPPSLCGRENAARQLNLIATQLTLNFYLAIVFACVLCMAMEKREREAEWECRGRGGAAHLGPLSLGEKCAMRGLLSHRVCASQKGDTKKVQNCDRGHFIN